MKRKIILLAIMIFVVAAEKITCMAEIEHYGNKKAKERWKDIQAQHLRPTTVEITDQELNNLLNDAYQSGIEDFIAKTQEFSKSKNIGLQKARIETKKQIKTKSTTTARQRLEKKIKALKQKQF